MDAVRNAAISAVTEILENGKKSHLITANVSEYKDFTDLDRAFYLKLVEGTVERKITLDYIIKMYSKVKINKMKSVIRNTLRVSIYQMIFLDHVPDSAAINEAVKIVKKRNMTGLSGFVNAVLRNVSKDKDKIIKKIDKAPLDIKYSVPMWIIDLLGDDKEVFLEHLYDERNINARLSLSQLCKEEIEDILKSTGVTYTDNPYMKDALYIKNFGDLKKNPAYAMGLITIQDTASMIPGTVCGVKEGDVVIDVCAAPGGKALHIADKLNGSGKVVAMDLSDNKVSLIRENIKRLKLKNVDTFASDARKTSSAYKGKADILILDLPCSGIGVIKNKPDIKYRLKETDIEELSKLQREIIGASMPYVKNGGKVVYSTCTLSSKENEENYKYILDNYDVETVDINEYLEDSLKCESGSNGYIRIVPGKVDMDGFFVSVFKKK